MSMAALVKEVYQLNHRFFEYDCDGEVESGDTSDHALASPATEQSVQAFEQKIGFRLPPSYREFLRLHDGWLGWSGLVHLLSVAQMTDGPHVVWIRQVKDEAKKYGHDAVVNGLVIGSRLGSADSVVLDVAQLDERGEMPVISWEHEENGRYRDFHHFLTSRAEMLRRLIAKHGK